VGRRASPAGSTRASARSGIVTAGSFLKESIGGRSWTDLPHSCQSGHPGIRRPHQGPATGMDRRRGV